MDDELITMKAAAAVLNVSKQRVQQLVVEEKLDAITNDRHERNRVLLRRSDVERLRVARGVGRYGRT